MDILVVSTRKRIADQDETTLAARYRKIMQKKNDRQRKQYHDRTFEEKQEKEKRRQALLDSVIISMVSEGQTVISNRAILLYLRQKVYSPDNQTYRVSARFLRAYMQQMRMVKSKVDIQQGLEGSVS